MVSAGTADLPVAEEAAVTAEVLGNNVERVYDVGVAGLHRLLANARTLNEANVIIVVAGMEGAGQCGRRSCGQTGHCRSDKCWIWRQFWRAFSSAVYA